MRKLGLAFLRSSKENQEKKNESVESKGFNITVKASEFLFKVYFNLNQ